MVFGIKEKRSLKLCSIANPLISQARSNRRRFDTSLLRHLIVMIFSYSLSMHLTRFCTQSLYKSLHNNGTIAPRPHTRTSGISNTGKTSFSKIINYYSTLYILSPTSLSALWSIGFVRVIRVTGNLSSPRDHMGPGKNGVLWPIARSQAHHLIGGEGSDL